MDLGVKMRQLGAVVRFSRSTDRWHVLVSLGGQTDSGTGDTREAAIETVRARQAASGATHELARVCRALQAP